MKEGGRGVQGGYGREVVLGEGCFQVETVGKGWSEEGAWWAGSEGGSQVEEGWGWEPLGQLSLQPPPLSLW